MKVQYSTIEPLEARIAPAVIIVNSLGDTEVSGKTDLRQALAKADMDLSMHAGVVNTIIFKVPPAAANTENTITLTGGELTSNGDVIISGPGAGRLIIEAGGNNRIFDINDHNAATDSPSIISGLSLQGANESESGGAIYSLESLTLKSVVISGNTAANGGGVYVHGATGAGTKVAISNSVIAGNSAAGYGGGLLVENLKSITISHSEVTGNVATNKSGGGLFADIYAGGAGMTITACLFSRNSASIGGGLFVESSATLATAKITISGSRIVGNFSTNAGASGGGGLFTGAGRTVVIGSTILNNTADCAGGGVDAAGFTSLTIASSLIGGNQTMTNTGVGQGGGGIMIQGAGSGALSPAKITGSKIADNRSASYGAGLYAIDGVSLTVSESTFSGNHAFTAGGGIDAFGKGANEVDLSVTGSTFSDNSTGAEGGGIFLSGDGVLSVTGCRAAENAGFDGGGVYADSTASVTIKNLIATDNAANDAGGGLEIYHTGDFHVVGGSFTGNIAEVLGGGIALVGSEGSIAGATIAGNAASLFGGGLLNGGMGTVSPVMLDHTRIFTNSAPTDPDISGPYTSGTSG